jgi:hypothetical protein
MFSASLRGFYMFDCLRFTTGQTYFGGNTLVPPCLTSSGCQNVSTGQTCFGGENLPRSSAFPAQCENRQNSFAKNDR